jgi:hypothetical protein
MGFLDFLTGKIECPRCGAKGARGSGGRIQCPNPSCAYYDPALGGRGEVRQATTAAVAGRGGFAPAKPVAIRYRNFQGQEKTFTADAESAVRKKNHLSVRVAPQGERIVLSRDRIQNLREVEDVFPQRVAPGQPWPTPRERQVLAYHKKYKSTSPLYEKIRAKYPNW